MLRGFVVALPGFAVFFFAVAVALGCGRSEAERQEAFGAQSRSPGVRSISDWWNQLSRAVASSGQ
jgi:hypothetical protein